MVDYLGKKIKFNIEDNDLQKIRFNKVYGESQQAASPSPDNLSEIENLEGENICPSLNTTRTINGVTFTKNKDGSYTLNGTASAEVNYPINVNTTTNTRTVLLKANSKYRMLSSYESGKYTTQVFYLKNNATTYASSLIETVEETKAGMYIRVYKDAVLENVTIYPQITKGEEDKPYVPYNSLEIKDVGKNLYAGNEITINGTYSSNTSVDLGSRYLSEGTYTISLTNSLPNNSYIYLGANGSIVTAIRDKATFTLTEEQNFPMRLIVKAGTYSNFTTKIMIEEGTVAKPYEPYKQQTEYFPLSEGQKLYKNSYLAEDGTHHKRNQVVLDGSDNMDWYMDAISGTSTDYFYTRTVGITTENINSVICSHLKKGSQSIQGFWATTVFCITMNKTVIGIISSDTMAQRITKFKTWLATQYANGTPVIVEYELAEEEIVPYTETQKEAWEKLRHFKGLNGENNITAQGTMTSTLDLTLYNVAEEDFDIYISKKGYFGALKYDINNLIDFMESNIPSIAEATESSVKIAGRDGDIPLNTVYEPLSFEIVCYTEDNLTPEEKIVEEQKVTSLLNSIKNQTKTLFMEREKKFYKVKYSGNLSVVRYPKHLKFTIPLKSSESYAMNCEESEIIGNGIKISNTIKDTGAIFTIKGPAIKPIISLNNYQMKYNENILEGNSLIINSEDSTITHITSAGVKTNAMRAYNHEFPKIKNGENQLAVSSGIDDENQVNVKWYDLKI